MIEWDGPDLQFLKSRIETGGMVLFAGAGFSHEARNARNETPPLGSDLAQRLAAQASLPYEGEPLPIVYDAVQNTIGTQRLWSYLRDLYTITSFPDWYSIIPQCVWYRIYTINIDDLLQRLYAKASQQRLDTIVCPTFPADRDVHFGTLQCIHLHGHVEHPDTGLVFNLSDFAHTTTVTNSWYQMLCEDLYRNPVVFVGTHLEESSFYHYLELRDQRARRIRETRPKSFLVNPSIGPIRVRSLQDRNIVPIECTAEQFFTSLASAVPQGLRLLDSVRTRVFPHLVFRPQARETDERINRYYDRIVPDALPKTVDAVPEQFFLGAEPIWQNIRQGHDARRNINDTLVDAVSRDDGGFRCIVLHGPAGCGKTTTLMRVAYTLAGSGARVYFAKGTERIDLDCLIGLIQQHDESSNRFFLFVDTMSRQLGAIDQVRNALKKCKTLTLVLADRTNTYNSRCQAVADFTPEEVAMPDLADADIQSVLERLAAFGFLGVLRGKTPQQQLDAFKIRAQRQLLVAMREATSGKGFDVILRSEFAALPTEAQLAYVICCLAVARGAPGVYRRHLFPCLGNVSLKKKDLIDIEMRGVLLPANDTATLIKPRHRLIAHWVVSEIAPSGLRYEATKSYLQQISGDIVPNEIRRRSPAYLAYRGLINCDGLYDLLGHEQEVIGLYKEVRDFYDKDFLFWLQYAMAHIRAGDLEVAENYLNQSLAIRSSSHQTLHHMGILYLMQATRATEPIGAQEKAKQGILLLSQQIKERGDYDSYPYSAYLTYVCRWYAHASKVVSQHQWEDLRKVGEEALKKYPRDSITKEAVTEVEKAYMMRAVKKP